MVAVYLKFARKYKKSIFIFSAFFILLGVSFGALTLAQETMKGEVWQIDDARTEIVKSEKAKEIENRQDKDLPEKRTMFSKTFNNGDGTFSKESFLLPINYRDNKGDWQSISTEIVRSTDDDYDYMNETNLFKTYFSVDPFGDIKNIKYQIGDAWMKFNTVNKVGIEIGEGLTMTEEKEYEELKEEFREKHTINFLGFFKKYLPSMKELGQVKGKNKNAFYYPEVIEISEKENILIEAGYEISSVKLLEEIILTEPENIKEISQEVELHNVYAKEEGNIIVFYKKNTNQRLWYLARPVMYEYFERWDEETNNPSRFENYDIDYKIECKNSKTLIENCQTLIISKLISEKGIDWINAPEREYPIVIDLTVNYDFIDTADNWAYEKGPALPTSPTDYTESATSTDYTAISASNDSRWSTDIATTTGQYDSQIYTYTIDQTIISEIASIEAQWEGYGDTSASKNTYLKVWKNASSTWEQLDSIDFTSATDQTASGTISSSISSYINSSSTFSVLMSTEKNLLSQGESCSSGAECQSTFCVDEYCCNTTCTGTCAACDVAGSLGACTNVPDSTDPDGECGAVTCTNYIYGWSGNNCAKYSGSSSNNGDCNGSGACYTSVADSCSGIGATSASCGSSGCLEACVANALATSYDTVAEVCYTADQHSCFTDYECNASGTCEEVVIFCSGDAGDHNSTDTIGGDIVYCDNSDRLWTPTAATTYAWGGSGTDEPTNSCIGIGSRPACNYCDNLTYAGYSDWELPSCASGALNSSCILYQFGIDACGSYPCNPAWDTSGQANFYWSSTEFDKYSAWLLNFSACFTNYDDKNYDGYYVRCVRGQ